MALGLGADCLEREQRYGTGYVLCGYEGTAHIVPVSVRMMGLNYHGSGVS